MASTPKWFDRVMASSTTTGTGTYTLGSAITGYQAWSVVGDGNSAYYCAQEVDASGNPSGDWEVGVGTYTASGTTLSRDTLLASSTGSAISWAAGTRRIFVTSPAAFQTYGGLIHQAGGADAAQTMQVGALYVVDISAYTADRTYTLPAVAAVGDRCGIMLTAGDTAFELLITATSGDTLNGVAGGTEWSRLFITNEVVIMRCVVANTTWIVEHDGRIPMKCILELTTGADGETAATYTTPTAASTPGVWTVIVDTGDFTTASTSLFTARRASKMQISVGGRNKDAGTAGQYFGIQLLLNGATAIGSQTLDITSNQLTSATVGRLQNLAVGDTVTYQYRTQAGSLGLFAAASTFMTACEVLP